MRRNVTLRVRSSSIAVRRIELALDCLRHGGERHANDEKQASDENVTLGRKAQPFRILDRLLYGAKNVEKADDNDKRGVLEKVNSGVND